MIYLIVGKPRSGKTQFSVKKIFDLVEQNKQIIEKIENGEELKPNEIYRPIYADIKGLNIEGVELAPDDWRDAPDNAIIFYDEVHYKKEYEDLNGKPSQNPMIKDLTTHGHRNIDLYLITQAASRIERSIRGLVDCIYYVKRPQQKPNFATIYEFDKFYNEPAYAAEKGKQHDSYIFKFNDKYQNAYKSASAHTSIKFKIQRKFYVAIAAIVIMAFLAVKLMFSGGFVDIVKNGLGMSNDESVKVESNDSPIAATELDTKIKLCVDQFGWTAEQCKEAYDKPALDAKNSELENKTRNSMEKIMLDYNPSKPYDTVYQVRVEPTDFPKFSGCIEKDGKYVAYTQQGTILHDVAQDDCRRLIQDSDRPFDYFADKNSNQHTLPADQVNITQMTLEDIAKYQQAKEQGLI